jgi:hypothetical protein
MSYGFTATQPEGHLNTEMLMSILFVQFFLSYNGVRGEEAMTG